MGDARKDDRFWDELAPLVDGEPETVERHADLLADSDTHRDTRHEASRAADLLADAGADYVPPADLADRVLAQLDARTAGPADAFQGRGDRAETTASTAEAAHGDHEERAAKDEPEAPARSHGAADARTSGERPARGAKVIPLFGLAAVAAAALVALTGVLYAVLGGDDEPTPLAVQDGAWSGTIGRLARAADDDVSGVALRAPGQDTFAPAAEGAQLLPGTTLRTDERTRARLDLSDGTVLVVNHDTEVTLDPSAPRRLRLASGEVVTDVAHLANAPGAELVTPTGRVEVLGTKFILSATEEMASVRVTRGAVRIHAATGGTHEVKAGQEGLMPKSGAATVSPATSLAGDVAWSELGAAAEGTDEPIPGLGELRARRPGEREDRERPLHLAHHRVTVRVVGNVARTEIEETFRNDSEHTLEGIYRFPLPPDARIASLSLEVDGRWEEGAFVDRDRAQRIWRGVIRNATPEQQRVDQEEFIWVPGPWRDPALLEWQRGGRFELRIFPIPARGERRIRLAYTQTIAPHGHEGRRYTYPLAHSSDESTRVGRFEVDVRVAGSAPTRAHGYELSADREDNATRLRYAADNFLPKGDLIVDYQLPGGESELRWWTFQGEATVPPAESSREGNPEVVRLQREAHADQRGYVVFALRPELPAWTQSRSRDYVIVVDSSQSMVGERYDRAVQLVSHLVGEMDRRDRFLVMACDATCQRMGDAPELPSSRAASQVTGWLGSIQPAGASHLTRALGEAVESLEGKRHPDRDVRVIYVGDGAASIGHRRPASVAREVQALVDDPQVSFTTVGIGGDADTHTLEAIARAGGGHYVPYVPGQRSSMAALAVLETTYGVSLTSASLQLPDGITDVAPAELPTVRAGEELLVVGRLTGDRIRGEVRLHGKVGGREFTDRYPVTLDATDARGNAFVPRLWASESIQKLELEGRGENRDRIVALSKAYGVMSPHTSLLVLESEAMFRAFGVDRNQPALQWTGEEDMEVGTSEGLAARDNAGGLGLLGAGRGGLGTLSSGGGGGSASGFGGGDLDRRRSVVGAAPSAEPAPRSSSRTQAGPAAEAPAEEEDSLAGESREAEQPRRARRRAPATPPSARPGGRWMRRVWYRDAQVSTDGGARPAWLREVAQAEAALRENPDSRDRHRTLVRALSRAGQLDRAREIAEQWIARDRLDPEALTYLSDVLGRQGKREDAIRHLSGIVDLRPDDVVLQERLANAFDRAGLPERACAHRVALAEIQSDEPGAWAAALRCERSLGREGGASRILEGLPNEEARRRAEEAAREITRPGRLRGDLILEASWEGSSDVDLSLITPQGTRLSWLGGRVNVVGEDASRVGQERLGLRRTTVGSYAVEVSRSDPGDTSPVTGTIEVRIAMNGTLTQRRIPFRLGSTDTRVEAGRVDVVRRSRVVPF